MSENVIKECDNESTRSYKFSKKNTISKFGIDYNNTTQNRSFHSVDKHFEFPHHNSNLVYTDSQSNNIFETAMYSLGHNTFGTPT